MRGGSDILVYAASLSAPPQVGSINENDLMMLQESLGKPKSKHLDVILHTGGGSGEVVEDIVRMLHRLYEKVSIIVPGKAASAGTIWALAGHEILMEPTSSLGPIDAQIITRGKRFSAHALLSGLEEIKQQVKDTGSLNQAYIPILQGLSPGELQHAQNAQDFAVRIVAKWLAEYKFKDWTEHLTKGGPVTPEEKEARAKQIAADLSDHGKWLSHSKSIDMQDLLDLRVKIQDYSQDPELYDTIRRYYVLLRLSFDQGVGKVYQTLNSVMQVVSGAEESQTKGNHAQMPVPAQAATVINFQCPACKTFTKLQCNFVKGVPQLRPDFQPFPADNIFNCPKCKEKVQAGQVRTEIEKKTGRKIV
ncbi:MAG: Clp protease ClpP [Hyphomicrobiaceae bacterium]|nr:MAG: Clp protease ClpP [Hyphomicrobiaceae bacterium]